MHNSMNASTEFQIGKHNIGYISSDFQNKFKDTEFEAKQMPTFQKLPRSMNDLEIESELKPGLSELGDIVAFMDNAPEECKDGYWNLFYTESVVVRVSWDSYSRGWGVSARDRDAYAWSGGRRVFAPATNTSVSSISESSDTLSLEARVATIEAWMKVVKNS